MVQIVKNLPAMRKTWVQSLGQEDPLEKEMATHSSILDWRIPWTEEPGRLQSLGSQRVWHDWATNTHTHKPTQPFKINWMELISFVLKDSCLFFCCVLESIQRWLWNGGLLYRGFHFFHSNICWLLSFIVSPRTYGLLIRTSQTLEKIKRVT